MEAVVKTASVIIRSETGDAGAMFERARPVATVGFFALSCVSGFLIHQLVRLVMFHR